MLGLLLYHALTFVNYSKFPNLNLEKEACDDLILLLVISNLLSVCIMRFKGSPKSRINTSSLIVDKL